MHNMISSEAMLRQRQTESVLMMLQTQREVEKKIEFRYFFKLSSGSYFCQCFDVCYD